MINYAHLTCCCPTCKAKQDTESLEIKRLQAELDEFKRDEPKKLAEVKHYREIYRGVFEALGYKPEDIMPNAEELKQKIEELKQTK